MQRLLIVFLALFVWSGFALAGEIVKIPGRVTPVALGNACADAGGSFNSSSTGYSCEKSNCNGKGGTCGVYCDSGGKCVGTAPDGPARQSFVGLNAVNKSLLVLGNYANPASPPVADPNAVRSPTLKVFVAPSN